MRNADLADLAALLREQHARKVDLVVPATKMAMRDGVLIVKGAEAVLTDDGVTMVDGTYRPTAVFDEGVADKLKIPLAYLRRMRNDRVDLYDANVNGWMRGRHGLVQNPVRDQEGTWRWPDGTLAERGEQRWKREPIAPDDRKFLIRAFRDDSGGTGIARALLSDSYKMIDNLDALTAALDGVKASGVPVDIVACDLTERRMTVKIAAPQVRAYAPELLRGYRSPFSGASGTENPTVFAGFVLSNSETGGGAFTLTPRIVVQVCSNGMVVTKDVLRAVHLGGKMDEGLIRWSDDTVQKTTELITARTRDAVATFLDVEYVKAVIARLEDAGSKKVGDAVATVTQVAKKLSFTEAQTKGVLDFFVQGGQMTAAGVMNAVTAYAQTVDDADVAFDLEAAGLRALELAAS